MKKILLSVASLVTFLSATAQDAKFVIYDGTTTDILTGGKAYGFDGFAPGVGLVNSDTAYVLLEGNKVWYVEGSVAAGDSNYVGGTGNANFQAAPNDPTLFGINLINMNTATFSFKYLTDALANVDIDFESAVGTTSNLVGTAKFAIAPFLGISTVDTTLSVFKSATGAALSAADWATVNKITIKFSLLTKTGSIKAVLDEITITDGSLTSLSDEIAQNFKNEEVKVYTIAGALVASGLVQDLDLTSGFYIIKSATRADKVIIK